MLAEFIDPGRLRTELVLEEAVMTPDGAGGFTESWIEIAAVWALVEPVRAGVTYGADQTIAQVTHRITLRFRAELRSGMRLRKGDRLFAVRTVHDPDETGRYLVCRAEEIGR